MQCQTIAVATVSAKNGSDGNRFKNNTKIVKWCCAPFPTEIQYNVFDQETIYYDKSNNDGAPRVGEPILKFTM